MIKAVLSDLGNVLVGFSHERMHQQLSAVVGMEAAKIRHILIEDGWQHALESGRTGPHEFREGFRRLGTRDFSDADFDHALSDIFTEIPPMTALLPAFRKLGVRLLLVSNTSVIHFEWIKSRSPWLMYFDALVLSYEVGAAKPEPAYYQAALKAAGCEPAACLFVDDIEANVDGARAAGMQVHLFRSVRGLCAQARAAGLPLVEPVLN